MLHDALPKPMLIDGQQVSTANDPLVSINPAKGTINNTISVAGSDEVDRAVQSSARAAARPDWRNLQPHQRAAVLLRIGEFMQLARETGVDARGARIADGWLDEAIEAGHGKKYHPVISRLISA